MLKNHTMGIFLGLGAKAGCRFYNPKSKMASKMAAKKTFFLFFPSRKDLEKHVDFCVVVLKSNLQSMSRPQNAATCSNRFLQTYPKSVTKLENFIQVCYLAHCSTKNILLHTHYRKLKVFIVRIKFSI